MSGVNWVESLRSEGTRSWMVGVILMFLDVEFEVLGLFWFIGLKSCGFGFLGVFCVWVNLGSIFF